MTEHPLDTCHCGDYRRDHPGGGPCTFNDGGRDLTHGFKDCQSFRLVLRHKERSHD